MRDDAERDSLNDVVCLTVRCEGGQNHPSCVSAALMVSSVRYRNVIFSQPGTPTIHLAFREMLRLDAEPHTLRLGDCLSRLGY